MNAKEILEPFFSTKHENEVIREPWIQATDKRLWATNSHILIMCNTTFFDDVSMYKEKTTGNKIVDALKTEGNPIEISVVGMEKAVSECPQEEIDEEVDCEECDCTGYVHPTYTDKSGKQHVVEARCPFCHGYGFVETGGKKLVFNEKHAVDICGTLFAPEYIAKITHLARGVKLKKTDTITMYRTAKEMVIFNINDDITVVLMPLNVTPDNYNEWQVHTIEQIHTL